MDGISKKILNKLDGALACYNENDQKFHFIYCPNKVIDILGFDAHEFDKYYKDDAMLLINKEDKQRIEQAIFNAMNKNAELKVYNPSNNPKSKVRWFEIDTWSFNDHYYLLFSGMPQELQLFENIANDNADNIYVIDKSNFNLLYANCVYKAFCYEKKDDAPKCYNYIFKRNKPCDNCALIGSSDSKQDREITYEDNGRYYTTRFKDTLWNGIPAYIKYVRDITDEVNILKEKERIEKYFETVLKYLPGGVAVVKHDTNGNSAPEYLSDGFAKMLDMTMEEAWELYRGDALEGVHPDDREYVKSELGYCIDNRLEKKTLQYRLKNGKGKYIWVNARFSVITSIQGDAIVYADYYDVTAEKQAQEKMRQRYRDQIFQHYVVNDSNALILGHCNITQNRILEIQDKTNSDLLGRFGYDREEFFTGIGTLVVDDKERQMFYDRYLNEPSRKAYDANVNEVVLPCFIKLPNCPEGRYVQFKVNLVETPDTGDITGILTVTDITENTIKEKIMKKLLTTNYDLVADVDYLHDRYYIVSGGDHDIEETVGKLSSRVKQLLDNLVIDSDKELFKRMLSKDVILEKLKESGTYSFRYSIQGSDGEIKTKNMIVTGIDYRLGRICLIRTDVTDMLAAERRIKHDLEKALSEAEEASKVKSDFLSSMSHDIRTPMNAIVGMTTLAQANIGSDEKISEYLKKISISSQHLLSLINDILDMSQIEQSKIHMNLQPIHLEELVNQISSIMTSQAKDAGLNFHIKMEDIDNYIFSGDILRIKQILINLLSNAFKFTMEGGNVDFLVKEIKAHNEKNVRYCFTVKDTGIGMSDDFMKHLFEPFIRSDKVSKIEGTGLGLSITKGLVELMDGKICVQSKLNVGTQFDVELEFTLLKDKINTKDNFKEFNEEETLDCKHFLLVEDNAINSEILGELLTMRGATYVLKENGQEAIEEIINTPPNTYDAIFMDIQMPIMNGYDATKAIRNLDREDAKRIIILAMTANAFAQDVQQAIDSGMNGHISKPIDMNLLCSTLKELLD